MPPTDNLLFYGDNLDVLRRHIADESVDLVYLDPPFNSDQEYNAFFAEKDGSRAAAQIKAFEDTWEWDQGAAAAFQETVEMGGKVAQVMVAFRTFLGTTDMLAYLAMMAPRLIELHRALRTTGSLYLHCDPTASHYLKLLLDAVFGPESFRGEIIWRRTNARSTSGNWPRLHDVLLYYGKTDEVTFNSLKVKADDAKLPHTLITWKDGKKYQTFELTAPGQTQEGESGKPWRGFDPNKWGRHWANVHSAMDALDARELIHWPKKEGGFPRRRDEKPYVPGSRMITVGDVWVDIDRINQSAKERLGYPTQKPIELLERIVAASSNPGDTVLDPFCGCGTTIDAAQKLGRRWIGIDITHLAIGLIKARLQDAYGPAATYKVIGEPTTIEGARVLAETDPYQFQAWALGLVHARQAGQIKKGADRGIDGRLYFHDGREESRQVVFSVKAGKLQAGYVRDLAGVVEAEHADIGALISLDKPTQQMRTWAASQGFYESPWGRHPKIQLLTVGELLEGGRLDYPQTAGINRTFKKAPRAKKAAEAPSDLFD